MPASISLLYFLVGIVRHVFPLNLNQVPTLSNPLLGLVLTLREQDCCLLDKRQATSLMLIQISQEFLILGVWLRLRGLGDRRGGICFLHRRWRQIRVHGFVTYGSKCSGGKQHHCDQR